MTDPDVDDLRARDEADRKREAGYAESAAPPMRQEIIYHDGDGNLRLIVIPGWPSINDLVAIVRDARFHPPPFAPGGRRPDGNGPGPRGIA